MAGYIVVLFGSYAEPAAKALAAKAGGVAISRASFFDFETLHFAPLCPVYLYARDGAPLNKWKRAAIPSLLCDDPQYARVVRGNLDGLRCGQSIKWSAA